MQNSCQILLKITVGGDFENQSFNYIFQILCKGLKGTLLLFQGGEEKAKGMEGEVGHDGNYEW